MDNDFSFNSAIDRFRGEFDRISDETQSAYYNCDLPGFLFWYSLWLVSNPLTRFRLHGEKYRNEYLTAIHLYDMAGKSVQPDILRQIHSIAVKFIPDRLKQDRRKLYRGFLEKDFRTQILPAMEISSFVSKHLLTPLTISRSYLASVEKEMADRIAESDWSGLGYWWSVWTVAKRKGKTDNSWWDEYRKTDQRSLYFRLKEFLEVFDTTKTETGDYYYDVFSNPTVLSGNWEQPSQILRIAIMNLESFIRKPL